MQKNKPLLLVFAFIALFILKIWLNYFLMAQNGDTYNFFQMAYEYKKGNFLFESKRMPLFPLILSLSPVDYFESFGRVVVNLAYFASIYVFYRILQFYIKDDKWKILGTILFATNMIILDNSFYIMADMLSTFSFLTFLYFYKTHEINLTYQNVFLTILVGMMAFYIRPEGIILPAILLFKLMQLKEYKKVLFSCFIIVALVSPIFVRNCILHNSLIYSGYMQDKAGFNLSFKNLYMGFMLLLFGIGGLWVLPFISNLKKDLFNKKYLFSLEFIICAAYSALLVLWGPYIRLYHIPVILLIIFTTITLEKKVIKDIHMGKTLFALIISVVFYVFAVQYLNQRDLGMFKTSKGITLLFSPLILLAIYFYITKTRIRYGLGFVLLVSIINITVFTERFVNTRYKYYTIVQASKYYKNKLYDLKGTLGYSDESGVESWYLRKVSIDRYDAVDISPEEWVKNRNIKYYIYTDEMGAGSSKERDLRNYMNNFNPIKEFRSPSYGGYTKIVDISSPKISSNRILYQ